MIYKPKPYKGMFLKLLLRFSPPFNKQIIMRLKLTITLLTICCAQLSANVFGQRITLNEQGTSLKKVLNKIEKQSGYTFFYNKREIDLQSININILDESLYNTLDILFKDTPYSYDLQDKIIVLNRKNTAGVQNSDTENLRLRNKQQMISGVVRDGQGRVLEGVSVFVKGSTRGTSTDADGQYRIQVNMGETLVFRIIGFLSFETEVKSTQSVLNVILQPDPEGLDEVVVIGYGSVRKRDLTGAVSSLKSDVLDQTKNSSFINSMQGQISGVHITTGSGEPGSGSRVVIRGANSLTGNSDPLYVIDGIQINESDAPIASSRFGKSASRDPLSTINPADIVSIEVLKDASATAIYGSRGANGVIIVTTRQGKEGAPVLVYDGNVGTSYRAKSIEMLNGEEWIDYRRDYTLMPDGKRYEYGYFTDYLFFLNPGERDLNLLEPRDVYALPEYNWQDEMFRTATSTMHALSISGGTAYTKYAGSIGYNKEQGLLINNDYQRFNARLKFDHSKDRINVSFGLNSTYSIYNGAAQSGDGYNNMGILQTALVSRPLVFNNPLAVQTQGGWREPTANLNYVDRMTTVPNTSANATLSYKLLEGLYVSSTVSGTIVPSKTTEFYGKDTPWGYYLKGRAAVTNSEWWGWANINSVSYDVAFKNRTRLNALAAFELNGSRYENNFVTNSNYADETTGVYDISKGVTLEQLGSGAGIMHRMSYLSRVNYNIFEKYIVTASLRADGADRFGEDNRWGYFPSAAVAWQLNEEPFMKNLGLFEQLKLRLSYGRTGNSNIPEFRYMARMGNSFYGDVLGLVPSSLPNPKLKWEGTDQYNAGLDISSKNSRINLTVDLYNKITKDMLYLAIIPAQSGFKTQWQNLGRVHNKGVEVSLNTKNIVHDNFDWTSTLTLASNKNKIIEIGNGLTEAPIGAGSWSLSYIKLNDVGRIRVGEPMGQMYGYQMNGIYQMDDFDGWLDKTGTFAPNDPNIPWQERNWILKQGVVDPGNLGAARPGAMKFKNLDGSADNKITEADQTVIGRSTPKVYGGIGNNFRYKNFDLAVFFTYSLGAEVFNSTKFELEGGYPGEYYNITKDFWKNRWTPTNPTNEYPSYSDIGFYNSFATLSSSYYVENASFLRLQNVALSYMLPSHIAKTVGVSNIKVYYTGNNLFTLTPYSGYTPEVDSGNALLTGFDFIGYPRPTTHMLGINVTF